MSPSLAALTEILLMSSTDNFYQLVDVIKTCCNSSSRAKGNPGYKHNFIKYYKEIQMFTSDIIPTTVSTISNLKTIS